MRGWLLLGAGAAALAFPRAARAADTADSTAIALWSAGAVEAAAFIAGGRLVAEAHGDHFRDNAGWLTVEAGFVAAPIAAHAVVGEWDRGAWFALLPACALAGNAILFQTLPFAVEGGTLPEQRWMWTLFGVGWMSSAAGVLDVMWAPARARKVTLRPLLGAGLVGASIGGEL